MSWAGEIMKTIRAFFMRFMGLFDREGKDRELAEEIDSILRMETEKHIRTGMDPAEACRQAHADFGSIESMKESYRDRRGLPLIDAAAQDLRHSARILYRAPGITAIAGLARVGQDVIQRGQFLGRSGSKPDVRGHRRIDQHEGESEWLRRP